MEKLAKIQTELLFLKPQTRTIILFFFLIKDIILWPKLSCQPRFRILGVGSPVLVGGLVAEQNFFLIWVKVSNRNGKHQSPWVRWAKKKKFNY